MTTFASDGTPTAAPAEPAAPPPAGIELTGQPQPLPDTPAPEVAAPPEPEPTAPEPAEPDAAADAEVVDGDSLPAVRDGADLATADQWVHQSDWAHDWLEFKGDKLAVRVPKGAALQALGSARHCSPEFQDRLVNLFVAKHISSETYERVMYRMIDPDDEEFTTGSWGELINAIAEIGAEAAKAEAEALAAAANGKARNGK